MFVVTRYELNASICDQGSRIGVVDSRMKPSWDLICGAVTLSMCVGPAWHRLTSVSDAPRTLEDDVKLSRLLERLPKRA